MADQPPKKFQKKGGGILKRARDLIKRPKPANDSASQSNSTRFSASVSSALGAHHLVPGNDAGSAEPTASSKYIHLCVIDDDLTFPDGNTTLNQGMYCPEFNSQI
jgi:hypothetical protein